MSANPSSKVFRLLLIEDNIGRVECFRAWLPPRVRLVWAQSAGQALGLIPRDPGRVYGGVLLDHDLGERAVTTDDESLSGSDVALALIQHFSPDVPILIHSTNQVQVPRIVRQFDEQGFWVTRIPFYDLTRDAFQVWLDEVLDLWDQY